MKYFNRLNLIFMGIMFMQVALLFVFIFLQQVEGMPQAETPQALAYVAIFLSIGALFGARIVRRNMMESTRQETEPSKIKARYQVAFLVGLALLEGPNIFCIITYWLTQDKLVLGIVLLLLIVQGSQKPGMNKFMMDMQLSQMDVDKIFKDDK